MPVIQDRESELEKKLADTQELLTSLLYSSPAVLYRREAKGNHAAMFISPNIKEHLGYEARDLLEDPRFWVDHVHPEDVLTIPAESTKLLELGYNVHEYRVRAKDGTYRWVRDEMKLVRDAQGKPLETVGTWIDISEQKRIEGVLKESEKNYRTLVDNTLVGIFKTNLKGEVLYVNDAIVRMLGFETPEELMAYPTPFTYKNPSDRAALVKQLIQSGRVESLETTYLTKTGGSKILLLNATLEGETLSGMAVDITDRKQAEKALIEEKSYLSVTLQSIGDGVITADILGNITTMNVVAEQLTGWTQEDAQGKSLTAIFHIVNALTRERCENPVQKVIQEGKISGLANHTKLIAKDGTERIIADTASPIRNKKGDILGVVLIFRDVTELEKAKKNKIELAQFTAIMDGLPSMIYIVDPYTYEIIYANKATQDLFHKDLIGGKCYYELQGFEEPCPYCTNNIILHNKGAPYAWEHYHPSINRHFLETDRLITWPDGRQVRFTNAMDITDRVKAAKNLQENEAKYRTLVQNIPQKIFHKDANFQWAYANDKMAADLKLPLDAIVGKTDYDFFPRELADKYRADDRRIMASGKTEDFEEKYIQDGDERWVHTIKTPIIDEGKSIGILGIFWDITSRKVAEEQLKQSETNFRTLVANIPQKICLKDKNLKWLYINDNFARDLEISPEAAVGKTEYDYFPKALADKYHADDRRILESKVTEEIEEKYLQKGEDRWVNTIKTPILDEHGIANGVLVIFWDITERKRIEGQLKQREEKYRNLFEQTPVGIFRSKIDGSAILAVNNKCAEMFGYRKEEMIANPGTFVWAHPKERAELVRQLKENGILSDFEMQAVTKNGEIRTFLTSLTLYPADDYLEGMVIDITDRKRAEVALEASEENYRNMIANLREGIYVVTLLDGTILNHNMEFVKILGFNQKENLIGRQTPDFWFNPEDRKGYLEEFQRYGFIRNYQVIAKKKDGTKIFVEVNARLVKDKQNNPTRIEGTIVDITERKRAEEKLQQGEARFRATFEQAAVGIAHASIEGQFLLVNQRFCDLVGYPREKLLKLTFQQITYPPDVEIDLNYHQQLLMGTIPTYSMEKRYVRKNKSLVWVNLTVSLAQETVGFPKYFITVIEDITAHKRAEEVLGRTMDALKRSNAELEQFAYVASHDLQEPLRMVSNYVQLLARRYKGKLDADADDFITYAVDGSNRMKSLINDLLSLSRVATRGEPFVNTSAAEVLDQALKNLEVAIEESKAVVVSDEPLPEVIVDPTQLGQVFQNLIGNAIKFHSERYPEIHVGVKQEKGEWVFFIKDNGIGIDAQYFDRLFNIFQRLNPKEKYPGTGIGLAVCKRIVERHGGRIWLESEINRGTTFYFSIPIKNAEEIKNE